MHTECFIATCKTKYTVDNIVNMIIFLIDNLFIETESPSKLAACFRICWQYNLFLD